MNSSTALTGQCALFKVLKEEAGGEMQGGVVKFR